MFSAKHVRLFSKTRTCFYKRTIGFCNVLDISELRFAAYI